MSPQNVCRVSASQREKILVLRSAFLAQMETIIKQRKEIVWTLQQATVMPDTASKRESAFVQVRTFKPGSGSVQNCAFS